MIFQLFRRAPENNSIALLYGAIVAQARTQAFYQSFGVPDTVTGRLEMILLHVALVFRRLNGGAERGSDRALGQAIFDLFCQDMDDNLREMGVGDLAVPRTMRRIGEAFYGRQAAYEAALACRRPAGADRCADPQCVRGRAGSCCGSRLMCGNSRAALMPAMRPRCAPAILDFPIRARQARAPSGTNHDTCC